MAGNEAPPFWYRKPGWQSCLLAPASWLYGSVAGYRLEHARPPAVDVPVLCIGNLTVGGSGKTPTAITLSRAATDAGFKPGFLTRGYGGTHRHPHRVDLAGDTAHAVGDEPLLLARHAPVVVGAKRAAGAQALVDDGVDFIIMDDGFQSRYLHYDYALIAIDAQRGAGNGAVLPGGPLRAPVADQMRRANGVLSIGSGDGADPLVRAAARAGNPVYLAELVPSSLDDLHGKRLLAYCGIGDPQKFYRTLAGHGCMPSATRDFGDHHLFTEHDAADLLQQAAADGLRLVTTEKDAVRLSHTVGPIAELREKTRVVLVDMVFENPETPAMLISNVVERFEERRAKKPL